MAIPAAVEVSPGMSAQLAHGVDVLYFICGDIGGDGEVLRHAPEEDLQETQYTGRATTQGQKGRYLAIVGARGDQVIVEGVPDAKLFLRSS